ncbi:MAG: Hsp20/alpha crystallin family protein [Acidobacteriota bacterium]
MANNILYNPYRVFSELQQQMQRYFDEAANAPTSSREASENWNPVVDIYETEDELVLLTELPGLNETDFQLNLENNVLTIYGERKFGNGENQYNIHRQERPVGKFRRSFTLPANIDTNNVVAKYSQGILRTALPKKPEARPRQIPVAVK